MAQGSSRRVARVVGACSGLVASVVAGVVGGLAGASHAQIADLSMPSMQDAGPVAPRAQHEQRVTLGSIDVLRVSPRGQLPASGPFSPRSCNVVASLTGASFTGGTFTVQAGFANNEGFAATYDVPAAQWPIRINLSEAIFATSNTIVNTTTQWGIEYWVGDPGTGTFVAGFNSDGDLLPHITIPAGTNGVNVQFSIDPSDPEQIILNNNGSNRFTVVWRINQLNSPSPTPCSSPAPSNRNAFPVTDNTVIGCGSGYAQLNFPLANWLLAINCGAGSCVPGGGFIRLGNLQADTNLGGFCFTGCRPRGDWVTRTTWSSVSCTPGVGSCCKPDGTCDVVTQADCLSISGTYNGDGTTCATANCLGACCQSNGTCSILSANGCAAINGTFRGVNTTCATANCPVPNGACCLNNGTFCLNLSATDCTGANGVFQGAGTVCGAGNTCPTGACCLPDGSCSVQTAAACAAASGTYRGNGSACAGANCPQPNGACCFANGFCLSLTSANCAGAGGTWRGALTQCSAGCGPTCDSLDFNQDGDFPTPLDLEDFIAANAGNICGTCSTDLDFNNDGDFPTPLDIEAFISVNAGGPCV